MCVNGHTPVSSGGRHSAAPDRHPPADSSSVLLASVQIAHLHELLLADIIHHVLHVHRHAGGKKKKRVTDLFVWHEKQEGECRWLMETV